jgi:hypothetical protein
MIVEKIETHLSAILAWWWRRWRWRKIWVFCHRPPSFVFFLFIQTFTSKMSLQTSPETRFGHSLGAMLRHLAQTLAERWTPMSQHGPQERQEEPT